MEKKSVFALLLFAAVVSAYADTTFVVELKSKPYGSNYADCAGTYLLSPWYQINGRQVYISLRSNDNNRYIFQNPDNRWVVTSLHYL